MIKLLKKNSYKEQVYDLLEKMILSGELIPGQRIVESELAGRLGVSRSPVREAIIQLQGVGLIKNTISGKGYFVSKISAKDITELYEARKLIETYAAKRGCLNCPGKIIKEMERVIYQLENAKDFDEWREKNMRFHELIVLSYGNKKLAQIHTQTVKNLRFCSYAALSVENRLEKTIDEHRMIFNAFLEKDPELVEKAVEKHIETVEKNVKQIGHRMPLLSMNKIFNEKEPG